MKPWQWILIAIGILLAARIFVYLLLLCVHHKAAPTRIGSESGILSYIFVVLMMPFLPIMEIWRTPRWRREWLERAGVKKGQVYLEEGFGFGTSPIIAAQMVGKRGRVYALDYQVINVVFLWMRAKMRGLKNLRVILSDARYTRLPRESVDVVFICDAFHEFGDKKGTVRELYRVLKTGGTLSIWDETEKKVSGHIRLIKASNLFTLMERDRKFCKFRKLERKNA